MDYNNVTDSTIFYLKFLQALLICDDLKEFLKEAEELEIDYTSIPLIEIFRDLIKAYTLNNSLPETISRNVIEYVNVCRFHSDTETKEETSKRFSVCNDIINYMNISKDKPEYPFYPSLINHLYRGLFRPWNHFLYANNPEGMQQLLNSYLSLEYYVLYSHTELLGDIDFMAFGCSFLLNGAYLESVEFLLQDIPTLANDPTFLRRIRKILKENENLLKEYQGNPVASSDSYLEDEDTEYVTDKYFWRLHNKVKKKIEKCSKDS